MTIISTAKPVSLEEALEIADQREGIKSFPPIDDLISNVKAIDWTEVQLRALMGINYVGQGLSVVGRSIYTLGEAMKKA